MKTRLHRNLLIFIFLLPLCVYGQHIQAPQGEICPGECYNLTIEGLEDQTSYVFNWEVSYFNNVEYFETQEPLLDYCFWNPGIYTISATVLGVDGQVLTLDSIQVYVLEFFDYYVEIETIGSGYCPAYEEGGQTPPGTACQKVCGGSVVFYQATDIFGDFYFDWFISGAESWEVQQGGYRVRVVWGESGSGQVEIFTFNQCFQYSDFLCVEIDPKPEASFNTTPAAEGGVVSLCPGETVFFENTSENATTYDWNFGDNYTSQAENPSHTYFEPGTYEVTLIAYNECLCADTTNLFVAVDELETPILDCISAVCAGETITYTSDAECGTYQWTVGPEGSIIEGGELEDNYITIEWGEGTEGLIELSIADCPGLDQCLGVASVQVPIISDAAQIAGPDIICRGETASYSLPLYEGTEFNWSVSNFGTIVSGQGTHSISVEWFDGAFPPGPQTVSVTFDNCYLGCGGMDTLEVFARPEFFVSGPIEVCENASEVYTSMNAQTNNAFNCNWTILAADGTTLWTSAAPEPAPAIDWIYGTGNFTLVATPEVPDDFCVAAYEAPVSVLANPPALDTIEGDSMICPGVTYAYQTTPDQTTNRIEWEINDGGNIYSKTGNPVTVSWGNTPPYSLSVTQTTTGGQPCTSDPIMLDIEAIGGVEINGTVDVCQDQTSNYTATAFDQVGYNWTISPADAGTITSDENSNAIEVLWHVGGPATVTVDLCGTSASFAVNVLPRPEPVVVHPSDLCPNETTVVQTSIAYASYTWKDETGSTVSTDAMPVLGPGYYQVVVADDFGCLGDATFHIDGFPASKVSISTPDPNAFCNVTPFTRLFATNTDTGYDFQWMHDGTPVGTNSPIFTATTMGTYWVEIVDENGCTATSNTISVIEDCGGGSFPNTGCGPLTTDFDIIPSSTCNVHTYANQTTGYNPGTLFWYFDDPGSGNNTSTDENPVHEFSSAGFYRVLLAAEFPNPADPANPLTCASIQVDTVLLAADFEFDNACPGQSVEFSDLSTFLPITSIDSWIWDFGDPGSGADNTSTDKNPVHVYANAGTYTVTLTVVSADGCDSKITKTIEVYPPPSVSFEEPAINCQRTASNFVADVPNTATDVQWDFGDPSSGEANTSELFNTYHAYDQPGTYTVTLEATSIYGCTNIFTRTIVIEPNGLSGNITASVPSPICEGDTTVLTAPPGGISWVWSNGATAEMISVTTTEVYAVTITDMEGCTHAPAPMPIDVIPTPQATTRAVEYDEYNQPVGYFYNNYETCEGEDVFLEVNENANYTYLWSTGETGTSIEFSEERGNLLSVGTHEITLTVTDNDSGCQNEVGPFTIIIHPLPTDVQIQSSPSGTVCANTVTTFSVVNPDPNLTYIWNTGNTGTSLTTSAGGDYYVRAINEFGCETESNKLTILDGPNVNLVPAGCHTRCRPDTLCLPDIPGAVSYQWFMNGSPVAGPAGTIPELVVNESGIYYLEVTDSDGCVQTSGGLNLDLYDGFGTILGNVYVDVNENDQIDAGDTLISNIPIQLLENNVPLDTALSNQEGSYAFPNILSTAYSLVLDTTALPAELIATTVQIDTQLVGCDDEVTVDWLLSPYCEPITNAVSLQVCEGQSVLFNGVSITGDTTFTAMYTSVNGCDSMDLVTATLIETDSNTVTLQACTGTTVSYEGTMLNPGDEQIFAYTNQNNCDSVVTVVVNELVPTSSSLELSACPGTTVEYDGQNLAPGTQQDFVFTNAAGCDSTVTVTVAALETSTLDLELFACQGATVEYDGQDLAPGTQQDFVFTNAAGCDSTVTVTVAALENSTTDLELFACPGSTVEYDGQELAPGTQQDFVYTNAAGCDSTVTVMVAALETSTLELELFACPGATVEYDGQDLAPGTQQDFVYTNAAGCDSTVTVMVAALETSTLELELFACPGATVEYDGQDLTPGTQQDFVYTNAAGCDSTVTVTVNTATADATSLNLSVCAGETTLYEGQELSEGMQQDFLFTNQWGCDSVVSVSVVAYPEIDFSWSSEESCPNEASGQLSIENISGGTAPFSYSLDGINYQPESSFTGQFGGTYTLSVQDANGCMVEDEVTIPTAPALNVAIDDAILPCNELSTTLEVQLISGDENTVTYQWEDGGTEPLRAVTEAGTFAVSISDACTTIVEEVEVELEDLGLSGNFYVPNAFSPNEDGINERFECYSSDAVQVADFNLYVFDRWGNQLFHTSNLGVGWDGSYKGRKAITGVYVWRLTATVNVCGQEFAVEEKGDVLLLR